MDPDNPRNNYITGKKLKRCRKNKGGNLPPSIDGTA